MSQVVRVYPDRNLLPEQSRRTHVGVPVVDIFDDDPGTGIHRGRTAPVRRPKKKTNVRLGGKRRTATDGRPTLLEASVRRHAFEA